MEQKKSTKNEISLIKQLIHSFDNTKHGFSARKLSAFVAVMTAIYATVEYVDTSTVVSALMVWLVFALLCLGIITAEQVLRFKEGDEEDKNEKLKSDNDPDPEI